jgi:hypothetical protein
MGMLSRYQKAGGFIQILKLIETCGKQKQEQFLNIIHGEDPKWSHAIKEKMLSMEKILSWPEATLAEIAGRLQPMTLATAKLGLSPGDWEKFTKTLSHSQRRGIDDLAAAKVASPAEISAAYVKIMEEVRLMMKEGYLRLEKFAPELHIDDDIEEKIGKHMGVGSATADKHETASDSAPNMEAFAPPPAGADANTVKEINGMRLKMQQLSQEVTTLKTENKTLKEKLANIKKLAA